MSRKSCSWILVVLILSFTNLYAVSYTTYNLTSCIFNSNFSNLEGWAAITSSGQSSVEIITVSNATGVYLRAEPYVTNPVSVQIWPSNITTFNNNGSSYTTYYYSGTTILFQPITFIDDTDDSRGPVQYPFDSLMLRIKYRGLTSNTLSTYSSGIIPGLFSVRIENCLQYIYGGDTARPELSNHGGVVMTGPYYSSFPDWNEMTFTWVPENPCDWWQIRNLQFTYQPLSSVNYVSGVVIDKIEIFGILVKED